MVKMRAELANLNDCAVPPLTCAATTILAVRKLGHLNIKTKMFDFEACV